MKSIGEIYLEKEFPQEHILSLNEFSDLLVKRRLFVTPGSVKPFLEYLEKTKTLLPAIKVRGPKKFKVIEKTDKNGKKEKYYEVLQPDESYDDGKVEERYGLGLILSPYYLRKLQSPDKLEFPDGSSFTPWQDDFKDEYQIVQIYYHPFQVVPAYLMKKALEFSVQLWHWNYKENWVADLASAIESRDSKNLLEDRFFLSRFKRLYRILPFLVDVSDIYLPDIRSKFKEPDPIDTDSKSNKKYLEWQQFKSTYDVKAKLIEYGISIKELKALREQLIAHMNYIDPLKGWSLLVRQIKYEKTQKLTGSSLLARDIFEITEILKFVIEDVTGEIQLEVDEVFDAKHGSWKVNFYGRRIRGRDREVLESMLTEYGINPRPWLLLIVEGKSEFEFYQELSNQGFFPIHALWIELFSLGGVTRPSKAIESLARFAVAPRIAKVLESGLVRMRHQPSKLFIIVDREGDFAKPQAEQTIKTKILRGITRHFTTDVPKDKLENYLDHMIRIKIRNTTFEEDLFTDVEILQALRKQSNRYSSVCSLIKPNISRWRATNARLDDLFKDATSPSLRLKKSELGRDLAKIIVSNLRSQTHQSREISQEVNEIAQFAFEYWYATGF